MIPSSARTVVIFHLGSIGDTVVMLPCLHAVARHFPDYRRILLTNKPDSARASSAEAVLTGSGLIDGAEHYPGGLVSPQAAWSLVRRLRATGARTLVYLAPRTSIWQVRRDLPFFRLAGIHRFVGLPRTQQSLARRLDSRGELEPEARFQARSLSSDIPVDLGPGSWDLKLTSAEHSAALARLAALPPDRPRLALCPGAKWAAKDWGEARWTDLVRQLRTRLPQVAPVMLGAADERGLAQRLLGQWEGPALNLCGEITARESAAVLGRCCVLICHDSGPMHLAAAQGTACVALFGNFNRPRQWFPWGEQHRVIHEPRGIEFIDVGTVLDAVCGLTQSVIQSSPLRTRHLYVVRN